MTLLQGAASLIQLKSSAVVDPTKQQCFAYFILTNQSKITTFDLEINFHERPKTNYYNMAHLTGVTATDIIADKVHVISSHKIFRRAKDLIDLSALIQCIEVNLHDIYADLRSKRRSLAENFSDFLSRKTDLEHAFNKLTGISNKPSFNEIYVLLLT
jgi:hypothetical protein